ncbi:flagellar biosynthetic protein FliO [Paraherbaspirillum soli]|uniref:Flagellar protein n=1 Tax=Paraherbaspirillum soli TaxID=631222 RepID=A0ABW0MDA3_9BURK
MKQNMLSRLASCWLTVGLGWAALPAAALPMNSALISGSAPAQPVAVSTAAAVPSWGAAGLLQAGLGLAVVVALIFLCAWVARRLGLQRHGNGQLVKVVASTMIGQRERVVVVEIGSSWLVLGVAPGQIQSLHSMPAEALPAADAAPVNFASLTASNAANLFAQKLRDALGNKRAAE